MFFNSDISSSFFNSFNELSKEFFNSFDIFPKIICNNEEILGMQYECNKGDIKKCENCNYKKEIYPTITEKIMLQLILILLTEIGFNNYIKQDINALTDYTLKTLIVYKDRVKDKIKVIFNT